MRAPIVLDDTDDTLYAAVPPTPTDNAFRRGLYVMLVVLGLFAAGGLVSSREAQEDLQRQRAIAEQQRDELQEQLEEVLASQQEQERRSEGLERLLVGLLARSEDPAVRDAFTEAARRYGIDPGNLDTIVPAPENPPPPESDRRVSPRSSSEPQAAPAPSQGPAPSPSPRPPAPVVIIDPPDQIHVEPVPLPPVPVPPLPTIEVSLPAAIRPDGVG